MIRKIEPFDYNYPFGKTYPLETFFKMIEERKITPNTGTIAEVIINGYVTNVLIENWNMYQVDEDFEILSLRELEIQAGGKVEICWVEKK
jgi:hypothetical protein